MTSELSVRELNELINTTLTNESYKIIKQNNAII